MKPKRYDQSSDLINIYDQGVTDITATVLQILSQSCKSTLLLGLPFCFLEQADYLN